MTALTGSAAETTAAESAATAGPAGAAGPPAVLVANRGEIAVRIIRTLRRLGLRSVAVHGDGDAGARHVRAADVAVRVGGASLADSYLNGPAIIAAARATGAAMIHPGYGFLSENAGFARACAEAGLTFVGPPPGAIEAMGDKIQAKRTVADAGVPLLPGFAEEAGRPMPDDELAEAAAKVGYPLLIKPSAGGGGKGMRLVREPGELVAAAAAARREAKAAFGDATLLVERFVERPRHIEVQVLADAHGNVVHLGERECSLQRRHQKIVEEAPSPLLGAAQRAAMGEAAVAAAKACGYVGAGTVEFIATGGGAAAQAAGAGSGSGHGAAEVPGGPLASSQADPRPGPPDGSADLWTAGGPDRSFDYSFLEMNTRLQVEHPVTEAVVTIGGRRGIDLVEAQLRVAMGEPLPFSQADIGFAGHAVESRVYAEDPARDFLPTGGPVLLLEEPEGTDVRVDSGLDEGTEITSAYDPMLAKVITWAPDRAGALQRMDAALAGYTLLGCGSNVAFLRRLLRHPDVAAGRLSTELTERIRPELLPDAQETPAEVYAAAALDRQLALEPTGPVVDRFDVPDGWRIGGPAWTTWRLRAPGREPVTVRVRRRAPVGPAAHGGAFEVAVDGSEPVTATAAREGAPPAADGAAAGRAGSGPPAAGPAGRDRTLVVGYAGRTVRYARVLEAGTLWLGLGGTAWQLHEETLLAPMREAESGGDGTVRSPMPGTVLSVPVRQGDSVAAGTPVVVVEAMKMEHSVTAPIDGVVTGLEVRPGQSVAMDTVLAVITPEAAPQDGTAATARSAPGASPATDTATDIQATKE
ncbi:acetyl-CoA/propionyl-CoA carboxylase biotin carboxyl carrier protein [Spinactinospora alkalitolerans]|uniref:biotin carboxylase n=1 Tax=Spinactinospora alkalitolerans TaxID=687207 RepID=A0A852U1M2_9ACTN|nr:biotin carboxylase N-terminal domain-containing protein [Spinactinospora alkalitolerans]NYE48873.1 acetyl-CoA/propionyl-CoA carboxylase biotin carboxyl carrier protein [Spinactinospora alkalitolerans]